MFCFPSDWVSENGWEMVTFGDSRPSDGPRQHCLSPLHQPHKNQRSQRDDFSNPGLSESEWVEPLNEDGGGMSPGVEVISCEHLLKGDGLQGKRTPVLAYRHQQYAAVTEG